MDKGIEIVAVKAAEVIPYLTWLNDVPKRKQVDSESAPSIIVNMMQGAYHGLLGLVDGEPIGLLIYHMIGEHKVSFKFLYGPEKMTQFYMALMEYFNQYKITSFEFESIHEPKLWNRLYPKRIKKVRSTYSFDVAGIFESKSQQKRRAVQAAAKDTNKRVNGYRANDKTQEA